MECDYIWWNGSVTEDLCWAGDDTVIEISRDTQVISKFTVNKEAKTCRREVLDSSYVPESLGCTQNGKVYITSFGRVRVYDLKTGSMDIWEPIELGGMISTVTVNENVIVFTDKGQGFIYTKERAFLHKMDTVHSLTTFVTPNNYFWGGTNSNNEYHIVDLDTNQTSWLPQGIETIVYCIGGTRQGYVYVTEAVYDTTDVHLSVRMESGPLMHFIDIGTLQFYFTGQQSTIQQWDGSTLMAFVSASKQIKIAVLEP